MIVGRKPMALIPFSCGPSADERSDDTIFVDPHWPLRRAGLCVSRLVLRGVPFVDLVAGDAAGGSRFAGPGRAFECHSVSSLNQACAKEAFGCFRSVKNRKGRVGR